MKNICFIIITYGEKYLNSCVESIKKCHPLIDIKIVDNKMDSHVNIKFDENVEYKKNTII